MGTSIPNFGANRASPLLHLQDGVKHSVLQSHKWPGQDQLPLLPLHPLEHQEGCAGPA